MTRDEFDNTRSWGEYACPDCGSKKTRPYPNCGCPPNPSGYGTLHINKWHHVCERTGQPKGPTSEEIERCRKTWGPCTCGAHRAELGDWPDAETEAEVPPPPEEHYEVEGDDSDGSYAVDSVCGRCGEVWPCSSYGKHGPEEPR